MFRLCLLNETLNVLFSSEVRTLVASLTEILVNGAHAPPSRPDPLATEADLGGVGEKLVRHVGDLKKALHCLVDPALLGLERVQGCQGRRLVPYQFIEQV